MAFEDAVWTLLKQIWGLLNSIGKWIVDAVSGFISNAVSTITGWVTSTSTWIVNTIQQLQIKLESALAWLKSTVGDIWTYIQDIHEWLSTGLGNIVDNIKKIYKDIKKLFTDLLSDIIAGWEYILTSVLGYFSQLWNDIKTAFTGMKIEITDWFTALVKQIGDGITWLADEIIKGTNVIMFGINNMFDNIKVELEQVVREIGEQFTAFIEDVMHFWGDWWEDVKAYIEDFVTIDEATLNKALNYLEDVNEKIIQRQKDKM
ncbi:hypothetical protein LCGC14_2454320 [marine sediment metagenome]|uniref:Uncharacterized protein n=1 Tax=marine sediment metagenome TaxID=412755 RepID=A0A0F9C2R4_9ZZZZ